MILVNLPNRAPTSAALSANNDRAGRLSTISLNYQRSRYHVHHGSSRFELPILGAFSGSLESRQLEFMVEIRSS